MEEVKEVVKEKGYIQKTEREMTIENKARGEKNRGES